MKVIAREFEWGDYATVQERFDQHWTHIGNPRNMMMIGERITARKTKVYLILPSNIVSVTYDGFEEIDQSTLPREASLLVGYPADFEKHFRYASRV